MEGEGAMIEIGLPIGQRIMAHQLAPRGGGEEEGRWDRSVVTQ